MTIASAAASLAVSSTARASTIHSSVALNNVLSLARGGAITAAATAASSALYQAASEIQSNKEVDNATLESSMIRGGSLSKITPQGSSVLCMAIAMSLHYLSYSIARPSTIALFTSAKTGFAGNTAAFPLAMAFISPTSLMLLFLYGKILGNAGPRGAIRQTTFMCASVLWAAGALIYFLQGMEISPIPIPFTDASIKVIQILVGALFIFRESYVQLLTSQYWAFMASILTPDQSAKWFSPISGLTSITSAISGLGVRTLVDKLGLPGALGVAGAILVMSLVFTEKAYTISDAVSRLR